MVSANSADVDQEFSMEEMFSKDDATMSTDESRLTGQEDESETSAEEANLAPCRSKVSERMDAIEHESCRISLTGNLSMKCKSIGKSGKTSLIRSKHDELKLMQKNSMKKIKTSSFTINKLKTSNLGLIGREKEIEALHSCYDRLMQDGNNNRELVFLKGWSGVGKSMIAKTLADKVASTKSGCFVAGKFNLNSSSDEPYSGIVSAFGNFFAILAKDAETRDLSNIVENLAMALGEDATMMMYLIPEFNHLIGDHSMSGVESNEGAYNLTDAQERWKYAFRTMTRVLTSIFHGLVLVLDDLQWSDVSSLDVIEYLVSDVENPNPLMIVGSYRSNEADENSILFNRIQSLLAKCDKFHFRITEIDVPNLDVHSVNNVIMSMLSIDDEETTKDLAKVCHQRTGGNPFFLLEFMTLLYDQKLVEFNFGPMQWQWEASKIEQMTMSTSNVVNLLQTRMRKLKTEVQLLLQYAACLGASFSISHLQLIWKQEKRKICNDHCLTVNGILEIATQEEMIERMNESEYRWVHDKVQEAALYLSDEINGAFRFDIGITLLYGLTPKEVEEKLFDIVDLFNSAKFNKGVRFAKLNLRAAEKARTMSAFRSASTYASHGIYFLPQGYWDIHRPLALKLYAIAAEMDLALGKAASSEQYVEEVLSQPNISIMESLPFRLAKVRKLCHVQLKFDDAINYCLPLLRELGYNLTWTRKTVPIQAMRSLHRSVKALNKTPKEVLENLSTTKDAKERFAALILDEINYAAYRSDDIYLSILCSTRLVEMTLEHGVNQFSANGIASVGASMLIIKKYNETCEDYDTCDKFCELALALERRFKGTSTSKTIYTAAAHGLCWSRLFADCLNPAMEGYRLGMKNGTVAFAGWNLLLHFVFLPYTMGKALGPMIETFPRLLSQLENVAQSGQVLILRAYWQMILNLQGRLQTSGNQLQGEIFCPTKDDEHFCSAIVHLCEGELMIFCSDYESAANRAVKKEDLYGKEMPAFLMNMIETFHRGVALYAMAQKKNSRKYRTCAGKIRQTIRNWMKCGNPNVIYFAKFLDAEHYALTSKLDQAEEQYKEAIVFTGRTGHLHHSGLFNERYADFLLHKRQDVNEAKYRLGEAIRYYEEWGAIGKVQQLKDRVASLQSYVVEYHKN